MGRGLAAALLILGLAGCGGGGGGSPSTPSSPTPAPTATPSTGLAIFDQSLLHETRLTLDAADWQALRDNYRTDQFYAANASLDAETFNQVGIRSRGSGSRDPVKPGLEIDFNKYQPNQEYHGYKSLHLDNLAQDNSMLRERLAFIVFEAMGHVAPRNAFTRLTVNNEYWGVYALVEDPSKPFLKSRLGEESGTLFDYQYLFPYDFGWRGPDPSAYVPVPFQPETNEDRADVADALIAFVDAINRTSDASFQGTISSFLDVDRFLSYVATENAMAERDGFLGEQAMNNFFLYQYGGQRRFVFIPWDKDTSFTNPTWPAYYHLDTNVLTRRLTADPAKMKVYTDAAKRAATSFVNSSYLGPRLESAYSQIRTQALADTKKPYTNADFENAVQVVRVIIGARAADVQSQVP